MSETIALELKGEDIIKLVRDHRRLQKSLGNDHFLVRAIWTELRRRQKLSSDEVDTAGISSNSAVDSDKEIHEPEITS